MALGMREGGRGRRAWGGEEGKGRGRLGRDGEMEGSQYESGPRRRVLGC